MRAPSKEPGHGWKTCRNFLQRHRRAVCTAKQAIWCCRLLSRAETPRQHPWVLRKSLLSKCCPCLHSDWGTCARRTLQTRLCWWLIYDDRPPSALSLASWLASPFFYSVGKGARNESSYKVDFYSSQSPRGGGHYNNTTNQIPVKVFSSSLQEKLAAFTKSAKQWFSKSVKPIACDKCQHT